MANMKVEVVSLVTTDSKQTNLENFLRYMDDAAENGVDLIMFPEYSLTGLPDRISMNVLVPEEKAHFEANAEFIPEGPTVSAVMERAKERNLYVCWTMMEQDKYYSGRIYNTAVLVGPEGLVGTYRKVHRAGTEALCFCKGDSASDVFDTPFGKVGFIICFDKLFPETVRELKLKGAEIILSPTAWPGLDRRLGNLDPSMQLYRYAGPTRAVENGVVYIDANLGARPGQNGSAQGGHPRIVDAMGRYLTEGSWDEGKFIAELDPQASIAEYYDHLRLSKEQHLKLLQRQQEVFEKTHLFWETVRINIGFYGNALGKTALDLGNALLFKYVLKK